MPSRDSLWVSFQRKLRNQGIAGVVKTVFRRVRNKIYPRAALHTFDKQFGVDTSGFIWTEDLKTGHPNDSFSEPYWGTQPSMFTQVMQAWKATLSATGIAVEDFVFFDVGCGKGRVLLMASEYPFRTITGIELNPGLVAIAEKNLAVWTKVPRACSSIQVIRDDATVPQLPEAPALVFMFNPFSGELVQRLVDHLAGLAATRPWPIDVIYVHPEHPAPFEERPGIEVLAKQHVSYSVEDIAADYLSPTSESFSIYRLPGALAQT